MNGADAMRSHDACLALQADTGREVGSSLVLAIFALALLTSMGIVLLFVAETETKAGMVDLSAKQAFYGSEAAVESGREQLRQWNIASGTLGLADELARAAGANGQIDLDPLALQPQYDSNGILNGFVGAIDDEPLIVLQSFEGGSYAAFLSNDPLEGRTVKTDANHRLLVTGVAVSNRGSFEISEAIVDNEDLIPAPSAAITILGPGPTFEGGSSASKLLTGDDCNGAGIPGLSVPVVGVIGTTEESLAEGGVTKPLTYVSGANTGVDTVDDISSTIDSRWTDCSYLRQLAERVKRLAHVDGDSSTPQGALGTPGAPKIVFINDDYSIGGGFIGAGVLWVTGDLIVNGNLGWQGPIFVVGKGYFRRSGGGTASISGGSIVANISGPDEILWTADDCSGPDGVSGNTDDGIAEGTWDVNGAGNGLTAYCTEHLKFFPLSWPFDPLDFRQR